MAVVESSIKLDFPDQNYFRFQDCLAYHSIQTHFKEMDVGWYDQDADIFYLIELKDWTLSALENLPKEDTSKRIWDLVKKSVDSACMLVSILLNTEQGKEIQKCLPYSINQQTTIKYITIFC